MCDSNFLCSLLVEVEVKEEQEEETGKEDEKFGNLAAEAELSEEGEAKALQKVEQVEEEVRI